MKRLVSLLLICVTLFEMNTVLLADNRTILALGDSISAGYGLNDRDAECFVSLLADEGDVVINKAVDGNEAPDIIDQLTNGENENYVSPEIIESADIITITCGGNDMMELLYEKIAAEYPNVHPRKKKIAADEVVGAMAEGDLWAIVAALHVLNNEHDAYFLNDGEFDERLETFIENLLWITGYIIDLNPDVKLVVATQYNPYVEFEKSSSLDVVYFGMEEGSDRLNGAIKDNAGLGGYIVADVKSAFDFYTGEEDLYNADPDSDNINLDFHPTRAGHALIAEVFGGVINAVHFLGVENTDGTYSLPENVLGYYITDAEDETRFVDAGIYEAREGDCVETVFVNVSMVDGAQVKITNGNGLRFIAMVDRSNFDAEYGMRITCEGCDEEVFIDADTWQSDTCFSVAIENMAVENYACNYTAVPYVRVRYDDGSEKVICSTQSVTRSIYTVAKGLLDKGVENEELRAVLEEYIKNVE